MLFRSTSAPKTSRRLQLLSDPITLPPLKRWNRLILHHSFPWGCPAPPHRRSCKVAVRHWARLTRPRHHRRAPRRCPASVRGAAPTDGRCSGGFTPEATVAARHANTLHCRYGAGTLRVCDLRGCFGAPCGFSARRGVPGGAAGSLIYLKAPSPARKNAPSILGLSLCCTPKALNC